MSIGAVLLVSKDRKAIQEIGGALRQLSLLPDPCGDPSAAVQLLKRRKFDGVVVDLRLGTHCKAVLRAVRNSASNARAVTFAVSDEGQPLDRQRNDANFTLDRPFSSRSIHGTLKAAYGLILRERRRYFRCPVCIPVIIHRAGAAEIYCYAQNLSEGGMALSTYVPLKQGEQVRAEFTIPGLKTAVSAESEICWCRTGQLGLRFKSLSPPCKVDLQEWLAERLEEMLPDIVSRAFEKSADVANVNASASFRKH